MNKSRLAGQDSLFGGDSGQLIPAPTLPAVERWSESERLTREKEILGFFITGHPLEKYSDKLLDFHARTAEEVGAMKVSTAKDVEICVAGVIAGLRVLKSRKGDLYAQAVLEDMTGSVDMLVFPEAYRKLGEKVKLEVPVLVRCGVRVEEGASPKLTVNDILALEEAQPKLANALRIRIPLESASESTVDALHELCLQRKGNAKLLFDLERQGDFMVVMEPDGYNVQPDRKFIHQVEELCGRGSVRIVG
jgi:DNA polymerase-3 subunit alpha